MSVGSPSEARSTNYGISWDYVGTLSYAVRSSADGTTLIHVDSYQTKPISISTNSGITWMRVGLSNKNIGCCATSADGSKFFAAAYNGLLYSSTNSGATWLTNNTPTNSWISLASSTDGTKLAAVARTDKIYTSTDSGLTWISTSAPSNNWFAIASSANGNQLVACRLTGIYISTNSGGSWTSNNIIAGGGIASSADGSKLVACNTNGQIYISTNHGISWISNNIVGRRWGCVASSADGNKLFAAEGADGAGGYVWTYQTTPSPNLNVATTNINVALSWLVPSTNFVLQQNSDLATTDWVTLTNTPTLNFTNLNYEVTLSPSNSSGFFRLITQ